jgi:integrase
MTEAIDSGLDPQGGGAAGRAAAQDFPRWEPWILLALRTGLRLGEQVGLQWGDVDWKGGSSLSNATSCRASSPHPSRINGVASISSRS